VPPQADGDEPHQAAQEAEQACRADLPVDRTILAVVADVGSTAAVGASTVTSGLAVVLQPPSVAAGTAWDSVPEPALAAASLLRFDLTNSSFRRSCRRPPTPRRRRGPASNGLTVTMSHHGRPSNAAHAGRRLGFPTKSRTERSISSHGEGVGVEAGGDGEVEGNAVGLGAGDGDGGADGEGEGDGSGGGEGEGFPDPDGDCFGEEEGVGEATPALVTTPGGRTDVRGAAPSPW